MKNNQFERKMDFLYFDQVQIRKLTRTAKNRN